FTECKLPAGYFIYVINTASAEHPYSVIGLSLKILTSCAKLVGRAFHSIETDGKSAWFEIDRNFAAGQLSMGSQAKNVVVTTNQPVYRLLHKFHREDDEHPFATDVLLVCKGGYIPMHSPILAAGSPILREHFAQRSKSERESTVVHLQDYSIADITAVATCFYTGSCVFPRKQVRNIYEIFEQLGVSSSGMTLCDAKPEDLKKRSFIRRYLDCVESEDEDMFIEEGERVNFADIPREALDQLGISRPDINPAERQNNEEESPDKILNGVVDPNDKPEKINYPHYVKTKPPLNATATKVNRDGVTGIKDGEEGSSSSSSEEQESESDSDAVQGPKSAKKRVVKSDDEESDDTVEPIAREGRKRSRGRYSKTRNGSTNKCRKKSDERSRSSSTSDDSNASNPKSNSSAEDSEDDDESDDPSNEEFTPHRATRTRSASKKRVLPRRKSSKRGKRNSHDSEKSNDGGFNKLTHSLRKRKIKCIYNEANSSDDVDETELNASKFKKKRKKSPSSTSSKESEFDPKADEDEEEEEGENDEEDEAENDEEDEAENGQEEESSSSGSCSSSADEGADDQGQDIDESEKCYLRNLVIRLEKLPPEEVEKYKRKSNPQGQRNNPNNSSIASGSAVELITPISADKAVSTLNGHVPPRGRSKSPKKPSGVNPKKTVSGASRKIASLDRVQPQSGTSENIHSQDRIQNDEGPVSEPKGKTTCSEVNVLPLLQTSSPVGEASSESRFVLTRSQAAEATRAVVEIPDPKNKRVPKDGRVIDKCALRRWYNETKLCQKCETPHTHHVGASRCLISQRFTRCWFCLKLLSSTENYLEHCKTNHSQGKPGHANCPLCQQILPWKRVSNHILQIHFTKKTISELENNDSRGHVGTDNDNTEDVTTEFATNDPGDETNENPVSPDANPGFGFAEWTSTTSPRSLDSDDESSRPLVTIKPAELLFESDHEDDNDVESSGPPSLSPQLNVTSPRPTLLEGRSLGSGLPTVESSNEEIHRNGNMPEQLHWLGETLRREEASRSGGHNKSTVKNLSLARPVSRPNLNPLINHHQMPGPSTRGPSVGPVAPKTFSHNINQTHASPSPPHLLPAIISRVDNSVPGCSSTPNINSLPSNGSQTNRSHDVFLNTSNLPNAPRVNKTLGMTGDRRNPPMISSIASLSVAPGNAGCNAFTNNTSSHNPTLGNAEAIRNIPMHSTQLGVSVNTETGRNRQHSDGNVNPESIADQIRNQLHCRKGVHATPSNLIPVSVNTVTARPTASVSQPSISNPNFATLTPIRNPSAPMVRVGSNQNINLATITPVSSASNTPAFKFRFTQPSTPVQSSAATMAASTLTSTASSRTLLVSNPSSVSTSSATLLSSRNIVPGSPQGQLRPVMNHLPVLNPESAIVAYNPNVVNNPPVNRPRPPPAYRGQANDTVAMPPPAGTVVLTSRALANMSTVSRDRRFVGSTVIEGVPFKVFSRPTNSEPHPQAVVSVIQDRVFNGRNIQRAPQNPSLPGLVYPQSDNNTVFGHEVLTAVSQFQTNMLIGEAVTVNELHSQANSIANYQQHQEINPLGEYIEPAEMGRHDNLIYRCESCGEEFNMEGNLRGHICFGVDDEDLLD
ncbi:unnamed protein product, partial [Allacma fusca]